jgi:hypothetical protein
MDGFDGKCLTEIEGLKRLLETAEKVDREMTEGLRVLIVGLLDDMLNDMAEWLRQQLTFSQILAGGSGISALLASFKSKTVGGIMLQLHDEFKKGTELRDEQIARIAASRQLIRQHAPSALQSMSAEELFKLFDIKGLTNFLEKLTTQAEHA